MSARLLDGLDPVAMLLLQVAARQEHVPVQLTVMAPLAEDPELVVARVAERGLLAPSEVDGIHVLTPMGHALRDEILARWAETHAALRPRLVEHLCDELGLDPESRLVSAFRAVDRAAFIPEPGRVLADIDMPAPTGIGEMTTSAPHAIAEILAALDPQPGERVLVCGGKGGVTAALSAHMVGYEGRVTVLDWSLRTVAHVRGALVSQGHHPTQVRALHQDDVTVGMPADGPWDCVVMNGSVPKIPWPLLDQLSDHGRLLLFLQEPMKAGQSCYLLRRDQDAVEQEALSRFTFTPIYGRYGWDRTDNLRREWLARRSRGES